MFGCSPVPVCLGMPCAGMGEEQEGQVWGDRPWHHGRVRKRVGGDGNLGALGGMAQLALFCPARPGPWLSLLLCSHPTFSLLLFFALSRAKPCLGGGERVVQVKEIISGESRDLFFLSSPFLLSEEQQSPARVHTEACQGCWHQEDALRPQGALLQSCP